MTLLLDANVLVALCAADHVHHDLTVIWFAQTREPFATSPITQGSALPLPTAGGSRRHRRARGAGSVTGHQRHEFWPDDAPFNADMRRGVIGHRQVTEAYLANQARRRGGRIATLDKGLVALHADVATLVT